MSNLLSNIEMPYSYSLLEKLASESIEINPFTYVNSGAGGELTLRANENAFENWSIVPTVLNDVSARDSAVTVLGTVFPSAFGLAPVGVQGIFHSEGELASARAAASLGVPYIASTLSTFSLEEIAKVSGDSPKWFQLYWSKDIEITLSMVDRAEAAGYSAIVITVDTALLGNRERDLNNNYSPFMLGKGSANYLHDPVFQSRLATATHKDESATIKKIIDIMFTPSLSWDDLRTIKSHTSLPILIKGILHEDDARKALHYGVDGIIVSNHGGRQLDGCIASLEALPNVADAIQGEIPILMDSGIRRGADVIKAKALGATAVLIGRPYIYGLAIAGEKGVSHVLNSLNKDIDISLALTGKTSMEMVNRSILRRN
ncbi:alpha-hydroxy-acid oxidizing protein [Sutcliffiella halmapala]|uniref:alpha-hydroxy-acid oxidizing protein n=1 Tax=Sutcliffiella halmapala TaxID=79882 RepID=UPI0009950A68|nr:alpha-hydroxy-acid oxidizing protein [Sutcliffiella halmapala]